MRRRMFRSKAFAALTHTEPGACVTTRAAHSFAQSPEFFLHSDLWQWAWLRRLAVVAAPYPHHVATTAKHSPRARETAHSDATVASWRQKITG